MAEDRGANRGGLSERERVKVLVNALQANNRSGTGVYVIQLGQRLAALAERDTVVFAWPRGFRVPQEGRQPNAQFIERTVSTPGARLWYDQWGVRSDLSDTRSDVVHFPANVGSVLPLRNMVVTIHDMTFFLHPEWYRYERALYYRRAVARSAHNAARIIAVSEATANDITEILRIPRDKIEVVNQGAHERFKRASDPAQAIARAHYKLPQRYVLYYGTIEPRKNLERLIQAWTAYAGKIEQDLVIAGRMGWKTQPIREEAERSQYKERIHFPGFIEDEYLPGVISAADVVALPSLYEGFGNAIQEGMACGVPVLTSNNSSMPEVAGGAAVLVDPLDLEAIADGLHRIITEQALRTELAAKGLERAKQLSWTKTAEGALRVYRQVAGRGG
ncbi:MAG: glycosyltransferase family 1 protein [Candidatus Hydrogenedentes bacterium]|nr:glycosyltransferase family 1 protein [Candidatus Hydrogenedentota bacterium]